MLPYPEIDGEENPTLTLAADEEYTLERVNTDGVFHNFAVLDDDREPIVSTDGITDEGETEPVEFAASEEMTEYLCEPHPDTISGGVVVESGE